MNMVAIRKMATDLERWNVPDYTELYWFNEAAEQATIKAILDGTSPARSWSDIQSTWGYVSKPKPRVIRVEKVKVKKIRPKKEKKFTHRSLNRMVYILTTNGIPMAEAVETAIRLLRD
jgi:hypothetical protein